MSEDLLFRLEYEGKKLRNLEADLKMLCEKEGPLDGKEVWELYKKIRNQNRVWSEINEQLILQE